MLRAHIASHLRGISTSAVARKPQPPPHTAPPARPAAATAAPARPAAPAQPFNPGTLFKLIHCDI